MTNGISEQRRRRIQEKLEEFRDQKTGGAVQYILEFNKTPADLKGDVDKFCHRPGKGQVPEFIEVLATLVQHSDEMAKEYQRVFNTPIQLSKGAKNAGYEWILRILRNDAVIAGSTNDVSNAVGQPGQQKPSIGITAFYRMRDKEKNPKLAFDVAYDIRPLMGVATEVVIAVINQAKHPHGAKLLIRWMMGDEKGGQGY